MKFFIFNEIFINSISPKKENVSLYLLTRNACARVVFISLKRLSIENKSYEGCAVTVLLFILS